MDEQSRNQISSLADLLINLKDEQNYGITFIFDSNTTTTLSYQQLYTKALQVLRNFQEGGIESESEIIFQLENNEEFVISFWACILGRYIPVPLPVSKTPEDRNRFTSVWKKLDHPYVIASTEDTDFLFRNIPEENQTSLREEVALHKISFQKCAVDHGPGSIHKASGDSMAFIQFSSGSTGKPKGVMLSHNNLLGQVFAIGNALPLAKECRCLTWMPLTHDMGLISHHLFPLSLGIQHYIMATSLFISHPLEWMNNMSKYKVHMTGCPNYGFKLLLDNLDPDTDYHWDLSSARSVSNSGEPVNFDVCEAFVHALEKYGLKHVVCIAYGLAEATLLSAYKGRICSDDCLSISKDCIAIGNKVQYDNENGIRYAMLGHYQDFGKLRICDDKGEALEEDTIGTIQICGKMTAKGYYHDQENTDKLITRDHWINTGDLGFLHNEKLVVIGRVKDIVFVNGKNYYLTDVDRIAEEADGVSGRVASCCIHNTSTDRDEVVIFIQNSLPSDAFSNLAKAIRIYVSSHLGLEIKEVLQTDAIPVTESGKIQRFKLAEFYNSLSHTESAESNKNYVAPATPLEEKVCQIWSSVLELDRIGMTDNFFECGGDSMDAQVIISEMEEQLGIILEGEDIFVYQTVSEVLAHYQSVSQES